MVNVAYAGVPSQSTPSDVVRFEGIGMTWTGWDGSVWDLANRASGVFLLSGVRGMGLPTGKRFRDQSPSSHGSQHQGFWWDEREVAWPIKTWHETGRQFVERDRAFFKTLHPGKVGRWTVTMPGGASRYLDLRLEPSKSDDGIDLLPTLFGWAKYLIYLVADQPFWVGQASVRSFKAPTSPEPFFEPTGPHLFNIGQGFTLANAAIDNLGDEKSYPKWFLDNGIEAGAWVGVGVLKVHVPFAVPEGKCLVIDSDPRAIGATMYDVVSGPASPSARVVGVDMINPVDKSEQIGEADFGAVEPGMSKPLDISFAGTGFVEAYLENLYDRAW